jgi:hypothetical protein
VIRRRRLSSRSNGGAHGKGKEKSGSKSTSQEEEEGFDEEAGGKIGRAQSREPRQDGEKKADQTVGFKTSSKEKAGNQKTGGSNTGRKSCRPGCAGGSSGSAAPDRHSRRLAVPDG